MIRLCSTVGDVLINPSNIISIEDLKAHANDGGTRGIRMRDHLFYEVSETLDQIEAMISGDK